MESQQEKNVARYMSQVKPIDSSWIEKRWAFSMGNETYLIENYIPGWDRYNPNQPTSSGLGWTVGQVIEWLKAIGVEPFLIEVEVKAT